MRRRADLKRNESRGRTYWCVPGFRFGSVFAGDVADPAALGNLLQSYSEGVRLLCRLPGVLKLPFYPSYCAVTFPMVITAIATKQAMACLTKLDMNAAWLSPVVLAETVIAAILVLYVLIRYLMDIFMKAKLPV